MDALLTRGEVSDAPRVASDWDGIVEWWELDRLAGYLEEMRDGKDCVVCTRGIDSYLVPDDFVTWSERSRLEQLSWPKDRIDERLDGWDRYVEKQRAARQNSEFTHRIISPDGFFLRAIDHHEGWVADISREFKSWSAEAAVAITSAETWRNVVMLIADEINLVEWDKIAIVDNKLALIRPTREMFLFTRDAERISRLANGIETATACLEYSFPANSNLTPSEFKRSSRHSITKLQELHRRVQAHKKKPPHR